MNNRYAVYTSATGEIQSAVNANADEVAAAHCELDQSFVRASRVVSSRDYVNLETGNINQRPTTPCTASRTEVPADGSTHVALSQMRPGTQIEIAGPASMSFVAEQSSEQITFTVPGEYTLTATAPWPARPKTVTIDAT